MTISSRRFWLSTSLLFLFVACGSDTDEDSPEGVGETPECAQGLQKCGDTCVDLGSSPEHCGACGEACAADEVCSVGTCTTECDPGLTLCGAACVELSNNSSHCGSCDNACVPGQGCEAGACVAVDLGTGGSGAATGGTSGNTGGSGNASSGSGGGGPTGEIEPVGELREEPGGDERESWERPRLAVSGDGTLYMSYLHNVRKSGRYLSHAEVVRWTGSGFEQLGENLGEAHDCSVGVAPVGGNPMPVVAYSWRHPGQHFDALVARWNGSSWEQLGSALDTPNTSKYAINATVIVDPSDRPIVYWWNADDSSDQENYWGRIARYSGGSWSELGEPFDIGSGSGQTFALADDGTLYFGWTRLGGFFNSRNPRNNSDAYVSRWDGSKWHNVGGTYLDTSSNENRMATNPAIAVDGSGRPVAAFIEPREDDGSKDNDAVVKVFDGGEWRQLGETLDIVSDEDAESVALAIKSDGHPVVAWIEGAPGSSFIQRAYIKHWDGQRWQLVGDAFDDAEQTADDIQIASDPSSDIVYVAYQENKGGDTFVRLLQVRL